jgi:hypothetical protein
VTRAQHRIHHASNPEYLDANFGGVLIVFDRLFGSFRQELAGVPIRYGLTKPIHSNNPIFIGLREWIAMLRDLTAARSLGEAVRSVFGAPRDVRQCSLPYKRSSG